MLYHILHHINLRRSGILNDVSTVLNGIIVTRSTMVKQNVIIQNDVNIPLVTDADNKN